jgi:pyruvate dehydrogenase (quinone)
VDVQAQEMKTGRSSRKPVNHTSTIPACPEHVPAHIDLEHAADILNRGKKIAILAGQGAMHATG